MLRSFLLTLLLLLAPSVLAQDGALVGRVLDASTALPLPGANLVIETTAYGTATDAEGRFQFESLVPGRYTLVVSSIGFQTERAAVTIRPGVTETLDIALREAAVNVGEVVVSARESLTGLGVLDLPGSMHYIGPERLAHFAHTDVNRVLREVPGVNLQEEEGYGLRPNVGLRGTGVERSSKITLMEDGVLMAPAPYAAPAAYYFPTMGRMDGVEVRTGSSQIKYGPYTTGGALNLIAAGIPSRTEARGDALLGPNGQRTLHARMGSTVPVASLGGLQVGVVGEAHLDNVDGFKTLQAPSGSVVDDYNTGFDKNDFFGRVRLATAPGASVYQALTVTAGYTDETSNETYLGLTADDFAATPYLRYAGSQRDQMNAEHTALRAQHVAVFSDRIDLTTTVYRNLFSRNWYKLDKVADGLVDDPDGDGGMTDQTVGIASVLDDPSTYAEELAVIEGLGPDGGRLYVKANNRDYYSQGVQSVAGLRLGAATGVSALVELGLRVHADQMDRFQWVDAYGLQDGAMTLQAAGTPGTDSNRLEDARAVSSFVQAEVDWGRLTVTPGLRFEHVTLRRTDYGNNDPARTGVDRSERENTVRAWIPGVGALVRATDALSLFAGVHRGFAPPDSRPETQPESSLNAEAGLRYGTPSLSIQAVGFHNAYSNLLGSDLAASGGQGSTDQYNGGAVDVTGAELSVTTDLSVLGRRVFGSMTGWAFPARLAYTYTDARFQSSFESEFEGWGTVQDGDRLPYLAPHQLAASVGVERGRFSVDLAGNVVAPMRTEAGQGAIPETSRIDPRFVLDASAEFAATSQFSVFGRVHNLTDATYVVARRPAGLRPGLPRTVAIGLRARL